MSSSATRSSGATSTKSSNGLKEEHGHDEGGYDSAYDCKDDSNFPTAVPATYPITRAWRRALASLQVGGPRTCLLSRQSMCLMACTGYSLSLIPVWATSAVFVPPRQAPTRRTCSSRTSTAFFVKTLIRRRHFRSSRRCRSSQLPQRRFASRRQRSSRRRQRPSRCAHGGADGGCRGVM